MAIFKGNLIAPQDFNLAFGGPVKFYFADVAANLHAVSAGVHAEGSTNGAGDADESLHSAKIVLRTIGDGAAEVGRGIHMSKIPLENDFRVWLRKLEDDPGEFAIIDTDRWILEPREKPPQ